MKQVGPSQQWKWEWPQHIWQLATCLLLVKHCWVVWMCFLTNLLCLDPLCELDLLELLAQCVSLWRMLCNMYQEAAGQHWSWQRAEHNCCVVWKCLLNNLHCLDPLSDLDLVQHECNMKGMYQCVQLAVNVMMTDESSTAGKWLVTLVVKLCQWLLCLGWGLWPWPLDSSCEANNKLTSCPLFLESDVKVTTHNTSSQWILSTFSTVFLCMYTCDLLWPWAFGWVTLAKIINEATGSISSLKENSRQAPLAWICLSFYELWPWPLCSMHRKLQIVAFKLYSYFNGMSSSCLMWVDSTDY